MFATHFRDISSLHQLWILTASPNFTEGPLATHQRRFISPSRGLHLFPLGNHTVLVHDRCRMLKIE